MHKDEHVNVDEVSNTSNANLDLPVLFNLRNCR